MVAPAITAPEASLTIPLRRAVVYWAHKGILQPESRIKARREQTTQREEDKFERYCFIRDLIQSDRSLYFVARLGIALACGSFGADLFLTTRHA